MVELGRISRSSFYRFDEDRPARRDGDMDSAMPSTAPPLE
jgi:hypothetical protein